MRANLTKASPFKSLLEGGKVPGTLHSPEMSEDEGRSFEDDTVMPSKLMDDSDEDRDWVGEDDEAGSCGESFAIRLSYGEIG